MNFTKKQKKAFYSKSTKETYKLRCKITPNSSLIATAFHLTFSTAKFDSLHRK